MRILIKLMLILLVSSCYNREKAAPTEPTAAKQFKLPVIVQSVDSNRFHYKSSEQLEDTEFLFLGKFDFGDTLKLSDHRMINNLYDRAFPEEKIYGRYNDTLPYDGFQIFTDYSSTVHFKEYSYTDSLKYYPIYVVNETSRPKYFSAKDGHAFGIQEAIDTSDECKCWRPVEYKSEEGCGVGYLKFRVNPGEYVLLLAPKYTGSIQTLVRIRLEIGNVIHLSKPFNGIVNPKQFDIPDDSYLARELNTPKLKYFIIRDKFFGAMPKGYSYYSKLYE